MTFLFILSFSWLFSACGPSGDAYHYTVTPGGSHVTVDPEYAQTLPINETQTFTVTPETGYVLSPIVVGNCAAGTWQGNTYTTGPITNNCTTLFSAILADNQNGEEETSSVTETTASPTPTPSTSLEISLGALALATNGMERTLTITNTGNDPALNVTYTLSTALPEGSVITPDHCGTIEPGDVCILTVNPGSTPSALPGALDAETPLLKSSGNNTNEVQSHISILDYGSFYQGGYLFDIDDTTPNSFSIGGKVAAIEDQTGIYPDGVIWSSNGNSSASIDVHFDEILGILETSVVPPDNCDGKLDGACNTAMIVNFYSEVNPAYYAAGICFSYAGGDYLDWYLPALCEMGYGEGGCGTAENPTVENMQSRLAENGNIGSLLEGESYWSSTQASAFPIAFAWYHNFNYNNQFAYTKEGTLTVRCVRYLSE